MTITKRIAVGLILAFCPLFASEIAFLNSQATTVPGPTAVWDLHLTTYCIPDEMGGYIGCDWQDGGSVSTPCLADFSLGCYLGSLIIETPQLSLPPGAVVDGAAQVYLVFIPGVSDRIGQLTLDIQSPFGNEMFRAYLFPEGGDDGTFQKRVPYDGRKLLGPLPPTVVDVYIAYQGTLGTDVPEWRPEPGEVFDFHRDFMLMNSAGEVSIDVPYRFVPVPEPSTALLFLLGGAVILSRAARVTRSRDAR